MYVYVYIRFSAISSQFFWPALGSSTAGFIVSSQFCRAFQCVALCVAFLVARMTFLLGLLKHSQTLVESVAQDVPSKRSALRTKWFSQ